MFLLVLSPLLITRTDLGCTWSPLTGWWRIYGTDCKRKRNDHWLVHRTFELEVGASGFVSFVMSFP